MAEWFKATVSNTVWAKALQGSNPCLSSENIKNKASKRFCSRWDLKGVRARNAPARVGAREISVSPHKNMNFEEKYFSHKENRLKYIELGSGKPVFFLHGGGIEALTYKKFLQKLAEKYHVIAPDLPFFGKSSLPKNMTEGIETLAALLSSFHFNQVALIGHSMGGFMSLKLSEENPKISALIIVNSAGIKNNYSGIKIFYQFFVKRTLNEFLLCNFPIFFLILWHFGKNFFRLILKAKLFLAAKNELLKDDLPTLEKIKTSTLILWGEDDELFSREIAQTFQQKILGSELRFQKGNHDWCLFNQEKFSEICSSWLKSQNYQ